MRINKKTLLIAVPILIVLIAIIIVIFMMSGNKVSSTKRVEGLVITNTEIKVDKKQHISFLTAKIKNSTKKKKTDVKLKIIVLDNSKKEITSVTGYVGDIDSKKSSEVSAAISMELNNVKNIKYEIVK